MLVRFFVALLPQVFHSFFVFIKKTNHEIPNLLFCLLLLAGLSLSAQHLTLKNYQQKLPERVSLVKVSDSIYYDKSEITNLDWGEYKWWLGEIYGKESPEYAAATPDTNIVQQQFPLVNPEVYLTAPPYRKLPVLGVSPEQARAYCQWRTDRVAESTLVKLRFMEWDNAQTRETYFTLEKYENTTPLHFLIFSLPTETTETRYGFRCVAKWQ